MPSVLLVAVIALVFAIGTGQHFTTFGLYVVGALFVATLISVFRWSYETITGSVMRSLGVRRRVLLVGDAARSPTCGHTLGSSRAGSTISSSATCGPGPTSPRPSPGSSSTS